MSSYNSWMEDIDAACLEMDVAQSNRMITGLHYRLSRALLEMLGPEGGPNFHSWAVWGSQKAGATIRQEDLDEAVQNATVTAGIAGGLVGAAAGLLCGRWLGWKAVYANATAGTVIGGFAGVTVGRQIAVWSRAKAAALVLEGNRTVLRDIGEQSARFLELLESGAREGDRARFFGGLRPGPTERHGQDRLADAFRSYLAAFDSTDAGLKRKAMVQGNCGVVYHEHIRLEPYIRGAMPFLVRRCATERMMKYEVGGRTFAVNENLPGASSDIAARNWVSIEQRMRYVSALFREFHSAPEVLAAPASGYE